MKVLFTDLDGTLLNKASLISDRSKQILKEFTNAGHLLVPNSGRPLLSISKLLDDAGISDIVRYIVAYNGALVWDCRKKETVWNACVDFHSAKIIQETCLEMGIHIQTYNHETIITVSKDKEIEYYMRKIFLPLRLSDDPIGSCDTEPYKMLAIDLNDHDKLCKLKDRLTPRISDRINMVFSNNNYLEFFNVNAGKGNAITELCKLIDVPVEDTLAAGDEENDISMLKAAGCGIAVKNATDSVKSAADVITEYDNDHDGLTLYISSAASLALATMALS
ncbi:MAG: Cof-type HAD-IIB family hydrolase [Lachnospiraceae bacterium]|nr:Cof-type HAD-IIB family hydrolase [Lachnospiraceae bacterium]